MSVTSVTPNNSYNWIGNAKNDPVTKTSNSNKNDFIIVEGNHGSAVGGNDLTANLSDNVDDGLTSLSWLQNLNMCMTRLGAPTPPTPPASPVCFNFNNQTIYNVRRPQPEAECGGQSTLANHHHDHRKKQQQQQQPSFTSSKTKTVNSHNHHRDHHHSNDIAIIALESSSKNHIIFTHDCNQHNNDNKQLLKKVDPTTLQRTTTTANTAKTTTIEYTSVQNPKSDRSKSSNGIDGGSSSSSSHKKSTNRRSICSKTTNYHHSNGKNKNDHPNSHSAVVVDNNGHPMQTTPDTSNDHLHHLHDQQPEPESVDYKMNGHIKPPYSYATLICMAMKANKNKMTLSAIYKWIRENFLYYRQADPSWQNSIRHNLSLNKCFIKIARNKDEPGKGGFWKLDPIYADSFIDGIFKKRRPNSGNNCNNNGNSNNNKAHQRLENKDEDGGGGGGSIKKKPRKKRATTTTTTTTRHIASIGHNSNNNEFYISYIETNENDNNLNNTVHQQETPPSSAESCAFREHKMIDINELNNAINNIDNHCTYTYAFPSGSLVDCGGSGTDGVIDPNLHGFSNEVCIDQSNECIIETDGNDICWNAILTDVDLSQLVDPIHYTDSVAQIINPIENNESSLANHHHYHQETSNNDNNKKSNAVQSNELEVTMDSNGSTLLEDSQLFFHPDNGRIHSLAAFNTQSNNQVISATSNVVTCINDTNMADNWNQHWSTYTTTIDGSMQIECSNVNGNELILGDLDQNSREVNMDEINILATDDQNNITFVAAMPTSSTVATNSNNNNNNNGDEQSDEHRHSTLTLNDPTMAQRSTTNNNNDIVLVNDSQSPTNFDANHSMQVWDCKTPTTSMDTSGLELDHFNSLDQLHQF